MAHILDPIAGYSNRALRVGTDIDADTVRRLGEKGEVFIVVTHGDGAPTANLCSRAQWLRAQARLTADGTSEDASVWRTRQELEIS